MSKYIIEGGKKLEGTVNISGSKNSSLPIIAATILNAGKTTLYNVPNIQDTQMMFKILQLLGAKVEKKNGKIMIKRCIQIRINYLNRNFIMFFKIGNKHRNTVN